MFPHPRRWSSSFEGAVRPVATSQIERNRRVSGVRMAWVCRLLARARNCIPSTHSIISASTTFALLARTMSCAVYQRCGIGLFVAVTILPVPLRGAGWITSLPRAPGMPRFDALLPWRTGQRSISRVRIETRGGWGNAPHPSVLSICRYI